MRTFIDLFAGCGGASLGFEQAGFEPVVVSEISQSAKKTYLANRRVDPGRVFGDVAEVTEEVLAGMSLGDVDLVAGGPPCQGYSTIGHRRSYGVEKHEVPSNHLYQEMARIVRTVRPKAFVFENVKGLLHGRWSRGGVPGEIWRDVLAEFESIPGYKVRWSLVRSCDYGVPQNRPRVIMVGVRDGSRWTPTNGRVADGLLPEPVGGYPQPDEILSDLADDYVPGRQLEEYLAPPSCDFQRYLRTRPDGADVGPRVLNNERSVHAPRIVQKFRHMLDNDGEIPLDMVTRKFDTRVIPKKWGDDGPLLTLTSLPDDFVHPTQPRCMTVREYARFQTFPDWYVFEGPRTVGNTRRSGKPTAGVWDRVLPQYTQIANAVPVLLARAIGKHLLSII